MKVRKAKPLPMAFIYPSVFVVRGYLLTVKDGGEYTAMNSFHLFFLCPVPTSVGTHRTEGG